MDITLHYDSEHDIAYLRFGNAPIALSKVVNDFVWLDYDSSGKICAVQIFEAKSHGILSDLLPRVPNRERVAELVHA